MYIGKSEMLAPSPARQGRPYLKRTMRTEKRSVVALVERGGAARAFHVPQRVTSQNLRQKVMPHADRKSKLHTDESPLYDSVGYDFFIHEAVHHGKGEYARGKGADLVTTNSVEGFFGIIRRGMIGVYQHCGEQHLQRYLNEFAFRYSYRVARGYDDAERAIIALKGSSGKRLTYRRISAA